VLRLRMAVTRMRGVRARAAPCGFQGAVLGEGKAAAGGGNGASEYFPE
jgi:hypothetical protein